MEFSHTTIWAFGGGKGGVGKSVLCANVAIVLARRQKRVILVDADLGGANLHTYLGIPFPKLTLLDFIQRRKETLEEVLIPTQVPNLQLITGATDILELANPQFAQKQRLIEAVKSLSADFILIDLGAGTNFNVLDFFNASHDGIIVVCPEPASIQNGYQFIKNALYRKISQEFYDCPGVLEMLDRTASPDYPDGCKNLVEFGERLRAMDPENWERYIRLKETYQPKLIINRAQNQKEMAVAEALRSTTRRFLDIDVKPVGYLPDDETVKRSTKFLKPFYLMEPKTDTAHKLDKIVDELLVSRRPHVRPVPGPVAPPKVEPPVKKDSQESSPESQQVGRQGGNPKGGWTNHPIPGINEDLTVEGQSVHVQTEDLGPSNGAIETQVFRGGQVVFKKTIPYPEEVSPDNRESLPGFLQNQHRTLISGIQMGKLKLT